MCKKLNVVGSLVKECEVREGEGGGCGVVWGGYSYRGEEGGGGINF